MVSGNAIDALIESSESFCLKLREGQGFDEKAYAELQDALKTCALMWHQQENIPKRAAIVLVDLYAAIESTSYLYQPTDSERITEAADNIAYLVRECVAP